jgi:hypothetical protein
VSLKTISQARFDALCRSRTPLALAVVREVEWFETDDERLLGVVQFHFDDEDWAFTVLGRDECGMFRAIDLGVSIETREKARELLEQRIAHHALNGGAVFPQGDTDRKRNELLQPQVDESRLHVHFKTLVGREHFTSAKEIIRELAYAFVDVDGNYVKDFQSTGFNARLWELYLSAFLYEQGFWMFREFSTPDFCVAKAAFRLGIEAVTVNPTFGEDPPVPKDQSELDAFRQDYMPIKFGSALYSKLQKRYWELPHMKDVPLIFAVQDFSADNSMMWSAPSLSEYLYGTRAKWWKDAEGKLHIEESPVAQHTWKGKTIPSGFFSLPGAENVSAVLFSNSATLSKFNRMGRLAGFGSDRTIMMRVGNRHNFDPNATEGIPFSIEVKPGSYNETWTDGIKIFLNPNARLTFPPEMFVGCAFEFLRDGRRVAVLPEWFVYTSGTIIVTPKEA